MIGYKFIQEKQWNEVHQSHQKLNADIAPATEFVREIERGNLDVSIETEMIDSELKTSLVTRIVNDNGAPLKRPAEQDGKSVTKRNAITEDSSNGKSHN